MTPEPAAGQTASAAALRAGLQRDLTAAMKARDPDAVAALRGALAAIGNAEAVAAPACGPAATSEHFAGARSGLGAAEATRRELGSRDLHAILRGQVDEHSREADRYDTLGQADAAGRLRRQARVIAAHLPPEGGGR